MVDKTSNKKGRMPANSANPALQAKTSGKGNRKVPVCSINPFDGGTF